MKYIDFEAQLAQIGGELAAQVVDNFDHFWTNRHPQQTDGVTKTRKISKEDGLITFSKQSSVEIEYIFRALAHQIPIKCQLSNGRTVYLDGATCDDSPSNCQERFYHDKAKSVLFIRASNDQFVGFKSFKIEGKSVIYPAGAFYANFLKQKDIFFV